MRPRSGVRARFIVALILAAVLAAGAARAEISQRDLQALSGSKLIFIATVRKDGNQSKAAPVWFTLSADRNSIMIQTGGKSWKAKRIFPNGIPRRRLVATDAGTQTI